MITLVPIPEPVTITNEKLEKILRDKFGKTFDLDSADVDLFEALETAGLEDCSEIVDLLYSSESVKVSIA